MPMPEVNTGLGNAPAQNAKILQKKLIGELVEERRTKASAEATGEAVDKVEDMGEAAVARTVTTAQHMAKRLISHGEAVYYPLPPMPDLEVPGPPPLEAPKLEPQTLEAAAFRVSGQETPSIELSNATLTGGESRIPPKGAVPPERIAKHSTPISEHPPSAIPSGVRQITPPPSPAAQGGLSPRQGMEWAKEQLWKKEAARRLEVRQTSDQGPQHLAGRLLPVSKTDQYSEIQAPPSLTHMVKEAETSLQRPPSLFRPGTSSRYAGGGGRGPDLPGEKRGAAPGGRAVPIQEPGTVPGGVKQTSAPRIRPVQRAKAHAVRHSQRRMVSNARRAPDRIRSAAEALRRVAAVVTKVAQAAIHGIATVLGLAGILIPFVLIAAVGALIASPFGILYSSQKPAPGTIPVSQAVGLLNREFSSKLDELQQGGYDSVEIHGGPAEWPEILAVFAVKTSLYDGASAADVVTIDQERVERLRAVFGDMNPVRTEVEEVQKVDHIEYILHIYIESRTPEEMAAFYHFQPAQKQALEELLKARDMLAELAGSLTISDAGASDLLQQIPPELSPDRRAAVKKALELVGKISYFWGGKSYSIGWDDRWGTLKQVTAPGSSTTGSWLPFGMDCSGYLDWTFRNAALPSDGHWYIGTNLTATTWEMAQPGDIVLNADASHLGIVVGRSDSGRVLAAHCSYSLNMVAISDAQAFGFTQVGTPRFYV